MKQDLKKNMFAFGIAALALGMLGMAFAAVPLYRIFCQVTGYAGTTQKAESAPGQVLAKTIKVYFDANTSQDIPWKFKPVQQSVTVHYGKPTLIHYTATNTSDETVTGTATFNVAPAVAGFYFNKIECFCFTEQTLKPGETVNMPVTFFVDPEMVKDPDAKNVKEITLSYTFFPSKKPGKKKSAKDKLAKLKP